MDMNKFNRTVQLLCPSCGCSQFIQETINNSKKITCASCGKTMTEDELKEKNGDAIHLNIHEMAHEARDYVEDELKKTLQKSFSNLKHIKFR